MALADITSRNAVLDAIDEYEDLGGDDFLGRYGTGLPRSLTIEYVGQRFPALPTLAVAHRIMHGSLLAAGELAAEYEAQERLEALGFRVSGATAPRPATRRRASSTGTRTPVSRQASRDSQPAPVRTVRPLAWDLDPDSMRTRAQLAAAYGCAKHGVVDTSERARSVLVFSAPATDGLSGWTGDATAYTLVGDGRRGDQAMTGGNQMLLGHAEKGYAVRVFEEADEPWRPGGKRYRYLGAFGLDPEKPWRTDRAPDGEGNERAVIAFRLLPSPPQAG